MLLKWLIGAGVLFVATGLVVVVIGYLLPSTHTATRSALYHQSPEAVWQAIENRLEAPSWRSDIKAVEILPDQDGRTTWRETGKFGTTTYEVMENDPPRRMVIRIADPDLPFGGTWTYDITASEGGSVLTITEDGVVHNPLFRFVSRFVMGHTATIDAYLRNLGGKFGEQVTLIPGRRT